MLVSLSLFSLSLSIPSRAPHFVLPPPPPSLPSLFTSLNSTTMMDIFQHILHHHTHCTLFEKLQFQQHHFFHQLFEKTTPLHESILVESHCLPVSYLPSQTMFAVVSFHAPPKSLCPLHPYQHIVQDGEVRTRSYHHHNYYYHQQNVSLVV